jgi:hypothetical protein
MEEVRTEAVARTLEFIRKHFDKVLREVPETALLGDLDAAANAVEPDDWCPREQLIDLFRAIAELSSDDNDAQDKLVGCGRFIAESATDDFTRLLWSILTPGLFVKKLPRLWQREHRGSGLIEVRGAEPAGAELELVDIAGYDHIGVVWLGWMQWVLEQLGPAQVRITQLGWTRSAPGPERVTYTVRWS